MRNYCTRSKDYEGKLAAPPRVGGANCLLQLSAVSPVALSVLPALAQSPDRGMVAGECGDVSQRVAQSIYFLRVARRRRSRMHRIPMNRVLSCLCPIEASISGNKTAKKY